MEYKLSQRFKMHFHGTYPGNRAAKSSVQMCSCDSEMVPRAATSQRGARVLPDDLVLVCTSKYGDVKSGRVLSMQKVAGGLDLYTVQMQDGVVGDLTMEDLARQFLANGTPVEVMAHGVWIEATLRRSVAPGLWEVSWQDGTISNVQELDMRPLDFDCDMFENPTCKRMSENARIPAASFAIWDMFPFLHLEASGLVNLHPTVINGSALTNYWQSICTLVIQRLHVRPAAWVGGPLVLEFMKKRAVTFNGLHQSNGKQDCRLALAAADETTCWTSVILLHPTNMVRNRMTAQQGFNASML